MPSILTVPPAIEPVSLSEAKAHLRIVHADEDQLLLLLIAAARRQVEARTGLVLIAQGWTQYLDDWPEEGIIALVPGPLSAFNDLVTYGEDDVAATIDPAHYFVEAASRPPRLLLRGSRAWARPGRIGNGIAITFTAGFGAAAEDVPAPLREAVLQLTAHGFEHRGTAAPPPVPLSVETLIAPYREVRL
jgi:uncharacterized phiE125 gp8 family phage protein